MTNKEVLTNYVYTLVNALIKAGVEDVVVSPGSRSTPLAYAFASLEQVKMYRHIDERSAAFVALGIAKAKMTPVVLVCTSGTAAANYFPAIVEAYYARIPLIVLTADRPHELREVGAPQAIAQPNLYGHHVKWAVDFPIPDENPNTLPFIEHHIHRAVNEAMTAPIGPVQVNVPFREPLLIDFTKQQQSLKMAQSFRTVQMPNEAAITKLNAIISTTTKGFIVIGEMDQKVVQNDLWQMIRQLKWPVLVESLSHLRTAIPEDCMPYIIDQYDAILKNDSFKQLMVPQTVIRFGAQPVSKPLSLYLTAVKPMHYIVIDEDAKYRDSLAVSTMHIQAQIGRWVTTLTAQAPFEKNYVATWQLANDIVTKHVENYIKNQTDEGALAGILFNAIPTNSNLIVSSSMPIRDVDTFFNKTERDIRIYANRGTNGIDGVVSTAFGVQLATNKESYLLIGDLAFLHDANGLITSRYQPCDLTIVVMNNDGGGIFSYLAQSTVEAHYEDLFGTPTGLTFDALAKMYDAQYDAVTSKAQLEQVFQQPKIAPVRIIEVFTNRQENVTTHRKLWQAINEEFDQVWQA